MAPSLGLDIPRQDLRCLGPLAMGLYGRFERLRELPIADP